MKGLALGLKVLKCQRLVSTRAWNLSPTGRRLGER